MTPRDRSRPAGPAPSVSETIGRKAGRKRRARLAGRQGVWFGLGMFGLVGWSIAVPTLLGIALGAWLDRRLPGPMSFTLAGLLGGLALGCLNAWYWVTRESQHD